MSEPMLVCHGGAGHTAKDQPGVDKAADAGWNILSAGGSAVEAVVAAVQIMEDDPQLNAGTGGRKRADGSVQLDAAIATSDGRLGAIMAIEDTPNPIQVAAGLLNESIHILVGEGARQWADQQGFPKAKVRGSDSPSGNGAIRSQLTNPGCSNTCSPTLHTSSGVLCPTSTAAAEALDKGRPIGATWSWEHTATPQRPSQLSL